MSNYRHRNRKYDIVQHDPAWHRTFDEEARRIKGIFGSDALSIEHIGSTAVPDIAAKPTIDILVIVKYAAVADQYNEPMAALGYSALGAFIADDTRLFEKEVGDERLFIIHVFEKDHPHTEDMIKTRDYLITHPDEAKAYEALKRNLKKRFPDDYISYRKVKNEYMKELTKKALETGRKEKFDIFLEVAGELNKSFKVTPILYGSLGLYRVIRESGTVSDVDILVPNEFVKEEWSELVALMRRLNFELKDKHEHEFIREEKIVAFATNLDLVERAGIRPEDLKISRENDVEFKELTPEQYHSVYQFVSGDSYRQEKRGTTDKDKIVLIKKFLTKN